MAGANASIDFGGWCGAKIYTLSSMPPLQLLCPSVSESNTHTHMHTMTSVALGLLLAIGGHTTGPKESVQTAQKTQVLLSGR